MQFRNATHEDIEMILTIENQGFNQDEAGTRDQYLDRIANFPETFIVAEDEQVGVLGFICGPAVNQRFVEDWMYEENPKNIAQGGYQTVQTVAVHQAAGGLGLGSQLLAQLTTRVQAAEREAIALTCLADRIPFYEKNGFTNLGPSQSTHAGEQWYNMEKILQHA